MASISIITFPLGHHIPLLHLVKIFSELSDEVYLISGGEIPNNLGSKVQIMRVNHSVSSNVFMRIIHYMCTQLKITAHAMRVTRKVNLFVLFIGGEGMLIPMIALKLLRKKVVVMPGGIATKVASTRKDPLTKILSLLISFDLSLADRLIIYSPLLAKKFVKHQRRVLIAHEHFVDLSKFVVKKKIDERLSIVGYIGRLSEEKGVLNLIEAVPLVLKIKPSTQFLICGKGDLSDKVKKIIKDKELEEHVKLNGWVLHEDVPRVLNELKLLVLPSYTEGLPNITLEAMACGTPVLATPVGAIPDVIKDGETGFLLKSNDPEHIAKKIIELLSKPELLEKVSINAYKYVRENFSYERTLESWRRILGELDSRE